MDRRPLRDQLRERIAADVISGRLEPGSRLGIVDLATRYRVSATPVREALTQLAHEGSLVAEPNRGFFVPDFSLREAADIYALLGTLEAVAIETQGVPDAGRVEQLRAIDAALLAATSVQHRIDADARWHRTLAAGSPNRVLQQLLKSLRAKAERYERAFMKAEHEIAASSAEHDELVQLMASGRVVPAAALIRRHWLRSLAFMEAFLTEREGPAPSAARRSPVPVG